MGADDLVLVGQVQGLRHLYQALEPPRSLKVNLAQICCDHLDIVLEGPGLQQASAAHQDDEEPDPVLLAQLPRRRPVVRAVGGPPIVEVAGGKQGKLIIKV